MKETACIVTGGKVSSVQLMSRICNRQDVLLIVVDGALELTDALGLQPDFIVGDFDTVSHEILEKYPQEIILRHPPEKDQTDTELAVDTAMEAGCRKIEMFGATGSRLDHSLANIFLLQSLLTKEIPVVLYDENNKLYLMEHDFEIKKQEQFGTFVSLLPLTDCVENVTLSGFKYSLEHRTFFREKTLGVSNEITEDTARVSFSKGIFLVIESKDKETLR